MLIALAWLTISLPYVTASQQVTKQLLQTSSDQPEDDNCSPLTNTTEEKTEGGVNTLSEYMHELYSSVQSISMVVRYYKCHPSDIYYAFHPDSFSPPPEL
jgi:hypothetical protein